MNHDDEVWDDVRAVRNRLGPANPVRSTVASADQLATGRSAVEAPGARATSAANTPAPASGPDVLGCGPSGWLPPWWQ